MTCSHCHPPCDRTGQDAIVQSHMLVEAMQAWGESGNAHHWQLKGMRGEGVLRTGRAQMSLYWWSCLINAQHSISWSAPPSSEGERVEVPKKMKWSQVKIRYIAFGKSSPILFYCNGRECILFKYLKYLTYLSFSS